MMDIDSNDEGDDNNQWEDSRKDMVEDEWESQIFWEHLKNIINLTL